MRRDPVGRGVLFGHSAQMGRARGAERSRGGDARRKDVEKGFTREGGVA